MENRKIVTSDNWQQAHAAPPVKEKELTRGHDRLAELEGTLFDQQSGKGLASATAHVTVVTVSERHFK